MYCIGRRDSQEFILNPYHNSKSKFQCVSAVVSLSGGTERVQSKINQLLKFVSEIQKGRVMDRCDWVGIGEVLVPGLRSPRNQSGASQRWAGGDWTADYWDRGKPPRFRTLLIIDTVASNQGSGHIWKLLIHKEPDQLIY